MSTHPAEAEEYVHRFRLEEHRHHLPPLPRPRARTRVATTLRRVADRLEQ